MEISYNWLKEYVDFDLTPEQLAEKLTMAGLEIEGARYLGEGLDGVIVARLDSVKPHPDADKLTVCDVYTGSETLPVVCGAKNHKEGDKVALAMVGARLPGGLKIKKAALRGVTSYGMLCSEKELGISTESAGIMILPHDAEIGRDMLGAAGLDDWVLEVNVTPNRPDCLSMVGVAREVAAITRSELKLPDTAVNETGEAIRGMVGIEIEDTELCPRYAARVIKGVKVGQSPFWMRMRLSALGVRSINSVVDVTNYVMLELGHPLHAFDYSLVKGNRIIVRSAAAGEMFTTLDEMERELEDGMLLICDEERPIALAGVMGGMNSEVTDDTADLLLEAAYFDPPCVRRTSKKVGLHTEASHRFERGADPEGLIRALDRAAKLIEEISGGKVATGVADEYPKRITMPEIRVRTGYVNRLLGADLDTREVEDILGRLQIDIKDVSGDAMTCTAPTFRPDLAREADYVEEVARLFGYGRIKSEMPYTGAATTGADPARKAAARVRGLMKDMGYNEVINYSFINPDDMGRLMLEEDDPRLTMIRLMNPLTEEQSVMRTMLLPSLLMNLAWNFSRGVREMKLFEISKVFLSEGPGLPDEPMRVGGLAVGGRTGELWDGPGGSVDFYDVKGSVEAVLEALGVTDATFSPAEEPFLHPGKSAALKLGGKAAGYVGQVHPDIMAGYDLPVDGYVFELDLREMVVTGETVRSYRPLPKYPAIERDLALILPEETPSSSVFKTVESLKLDLLEDMHVFDQYVGKPIPEGKKSLAYTLKYRSPERTLTDEEANAVHQIVVSAVKERLGAELREQ